MVKPMSFGTWKGVLPLGHCLAASWQRRAQRWLSNARIDREMLYGPFVLWALQHWQERGQALHLALDTTMLWNGCCVVMLAGVPCSGVIPPAPPPRLRRGGPRTSGDRLRGWHCKGWAGPFPWFENHLNQTNHAHQTLCRT